MTISSRLLGPRMGCDPLVHKATVAVMRIVRFDRGAGRQCPKCLQRVGKPLDPRALGITLAELPPATRTETRVRPRGNSRRRAYEARFREPDWPDKRALCLQLADHTCVVCGEEADQADHITYERFDAREETQEDLQAVCGPCNLELRARRIAG